MVWSHAFTFVLFVWAAQADKMLRFSCSGLVTQRLDPVVQPGQSPSQHLHQIVGGNAFNVTMDPKLDIPSKASCTSCTFTEDFSNYWTPELLYRSPKNGTFKRVPQMANSGFNGANGGTTVYYVTPDDASVNITAFAPGFRMVVGDPKQRKQGYGGAMNSYRCYTGKNFQPNPFGVSANDTAYFPKQYCAGGMRVAVFFPTCWDGKNLDSANHQSHVAFGYNGCPSTHPVRLPQVFLETVWDTSVFPASEWPQDGTQPFVWAQGDGTGYGHHADYLFGWKGDSLQRAMNARCDFSGCKELKTQSFAAGNKCVQPQIAKEPIDDWLETLPGNLTVTYA